MSRSAPRRVPHFVVDGEVHAGTVVALSPADAGHARRVLRLAPGDPVTIASRSGTFAGTIRAGDAPQVQVDVASAIGAPAGAGAAILALGMAHAGAMGDAVRGAVEMGAAAIVPFRSERGEHVEGGALAARVERWRRIAREAVKQCRRSDLPEVRDPVDFGELAGVPAASRVVLDPGAGRILQRDELVPPVLVVVGPEGGLAAAEVEALAASGFLVRSLGDRPVLRVATAAIAALALLPAGSGVAPRGDPIH